MQDNPKTKDRGVLNRCWFFNVPVSGIESGAVGMGPREYGGPGESEGGVVYVEGVEYVGGRKIGRWSGVCRGCRVCRSQEDRKVEWYM